MTPHHYSGDEEAVKRFLDQGKRTAKPEFPEGKLNEDDEGALAFAIAADPQKKVVVIDFNKPIRWIAMEAEFARKFKDLLTLKIAELEIATHHEEITS